MTDVPSPARISIVPPHDPSPSGTGASRPLRWGRRRGLLGAETGRIARPLAASLVITLMLVGAGAAEARPTHAPEHPPHDTGPRQASPCDDREGFRRLEFWLGDWIVYVGERQVGTNRIEKILAGCAIMEHWTDAGGNQGKSLFFYNPTTDRWKQVWVTQDATRPGGLKEKELVEALENGAVRFRGEIPLPGGRTYLDRTTLTPSPDGSLRQVIEVSRDGGQGWEVTFDARYVKAE